DAHHVQRVGGGDHHLLGFLRPAPHGAERLDRLGERELLADEAADEAPTPDLTPGLERAEGTQERAPAWHSRLAREQLADDDAVAAETLAGEAERIGVRRALDAGVEQRPAARGQQASAATPNGPQTAGATFCVRLQQCAESGGAVTRHQTAR